MYGIKDGILQTIPNTGYLNTGESVSNYNNLPLEVLISEGWTEITEYEIQG